MDYRIYIGVRNNKPVRGSEEDPADQNEGWADETTDKASPPTAPRPAVAAFAVGIVGILGIVFSLTWSTVGTD